MVFSCALGRWSWWLVQAETIPRAHEVLGDAASPDGITLTAPASRQSGAMGCSRQWYFLFAIGRPACSLYVCPQYCIGMLQ